MSSDRESLEIYRLQQVNEMLLNQVNGYRMMIDGLIRTNHDLLTTNHDLQLSYTHVCRRNGELERQVAALGGEI